MDTKVCNRCGVEQPIDNFRPYYGRETAKRYTFCKSCERIETRRKYLAGKRKKDALTETEALELRKIEELYKKRVEAGLQSPGLRPATTAVESLVDAQLSKYQ